MVRTVVAALIMGSALVYGAIVIVRVLVHLPAAVRRGDLPDLPSALGLALVVTMYAALFAIGAGLWARRHTSRPAAAAAWQRVFTVACGIALGLMLLILAVRIVPRL